MKQDKFLTELYDSLNDSPIQQKFKRLCPWPAGVVFIEWPDMSEEDIRNQFRLMKQLGFNCLKQCQTAPDSDRRKIMHMALDEGIIPWWYGEGGWENPTDELLLSLGISPDISIEDLRKNEIWLKRQEKIMRARIDREPVSVERVTDLEVTKQNPDLPGVVGRREYGIDPAFSKMFAKWLQQRYGTVENLKKAWHFEITMVNRRDWESWEDVEREAVALVNLEGKEYCRMKDTIRFKTDLFLEETRKCAMKHLAEHPNAPFRAGGEISLFLPMPSLCVDMERIADMMREFGSYYPSIHIAWHFEQVEFEFAKPVYMMSSLATDLFKGGWAATWESTGGPQILTGADAGFFPQMKEEPAGATIDGGALKQLLYSYMAGGFKGYGLWSFNPRVTGWEGGEYGLLDTDNQVTERAIAAGEIGRACQTYRDELWKQHKEPVVGILSDWENDALWTVLATRGRKIYEYYPVFARIGCNRVFINHNVPFEYVTPQNIRKGLLPRYEILYIPAFLGFDSSLLPYFEQFVQQGGRLVIDAPTGWYDIDGNVFVTREGTAFEKLFGARLANFQYARNTGRPWILDGCKLKGFVTDLVPTAAKIVKTFDDGKPAVTENSYGQGTAVIIGYDASMQCWKPGRTEWENQLVKWTLGGKALPYRCENCVVYRTCGEKADHYYFLNDGPDTSAVLKTDRKYRRATDPVTGEAIDLTQPVFVEGYSARWIRAEK